MNNFDPNGVGVDNGNLFGFPFSEENADIIVIPSPIDITASYRKGTSNAIHLIREASLQLDFFDFLLDNAWEYSSFLLNNCHANHIEDILKFSKAATEIITKQEKGISLNNVDLLILSDINDFLASYHTNIYELSKKVLRNGKIPAVLGGDHSSSFGNIKALSEKYRNFSVLQLDAHADLRNSYEGFVHSHASIMYNVKDFSSVSGITSVGVRDFSHEEFLLVDKSINFHAFFNQDIDSQLFNGVNWDQICHNIIQTLDDFVYITFDIDVLQPFYCNNTGTPVPGGLSFSQCVYLLEKVVKSKKRIIGFDLCEIGNSELDASFGSRILYKLINCTHYSKLIHC